MRAGLRVFRRRRLRTPRPHAWLAQLELAHRVVFKHDSGDAGWDGCVEVDRDTREKGADAGRVGGCVAGVLSEQGELIAIVEAHFCGMQPHAGGEA